MTDLMLEHQLKPIYTILEKNNVVELSYNGSGQTAFLDCDGQWDEICLLNHLNGDPEQAIRTIATLIASYNGADFSKSTPLLSGTLPKGQRVQFVHESICEGNAPAFSIRKPSSLGFTFEDYVSNESFTNIEKINDNSMHLSDAILLEFYQAGNYQELIRNAVILKKNIIISGGTASGKTTFFNAMLSLIPKEERLISIEDSREINFPLKNKLHLVAPETSSNVKFSDLLKACLRLRPNRIMAAEIRGSEAFSFLQAINSGHAGSITTMHANSASSAFDRLYLMLCQANLGLNYDTTLKYIKSSVDIVIQMKNYQPSEIWLGVANE